MKRLGLIIAVFGVTVSAQQAQQAPQVKNFPPEIFENGFIMLDRLDSKAFGKKEGKIINPIMTAEDQAKVAELGLEQFEPNFNFVSEKPKDQVEPWLGRNFDVRKKADAQKLSEILQAYIFEGWFDNADLDKPDTHFRQNDQRTWCQTPWLNVTDKGREAIHGLTKEFPIGSGSVYKVPDEIGRNGLAVTWGSSFFNSKVCRSYNDFFHNEKNILKLARSKKPVFETADGTISFKLLFNAMPDWENNMKGQWTGAYNWNAHVSNSRNNPTRKIMNIPLVQIDIGLRDSRLPGTDPELKNWIMTSYYFDASYTNPELAGKNIPEGLKHMRPIGLQYGLDAGESFIFEGSNNNHRPDKITELPYEKTRLNGPVDNITSSCLGCHAQSGMNANLPDGQKASQNGLGFMTKAEYLHWSKQLDGRGFDFNMQVDKAFRNFAASRKVKINGPEPVK